MDQENMKTFLLCIISLLMQFHTGISMHHYNTSLCRQDQRQFLLQFNQNLLPFQSDYYDQVCAPYLPNNYHRTKYWKEIQDCCDWDSVTCDDSTGFVIGLDLSCGGLTGIIHSNSTLFRLTHLQNLNLAFNNFSASQVSPKLGWLSSLTHLNLSQSEFSGPVPQELYYLSNLISLDMSWSDNVYCDLKLLFKNMTKIESLVLPGTNISSEIPTNMSSFLTYLDLGWTGLHGNLQMNFFERPNLQVLRLGGNAGLKGSLPSTLNRSSVHSLRELDLSFTSISGRLPDSIGMLNNLVRIGLSDTNISGRLPESIGMLNNLVFIGLYETNISGKLPESIGLLKNLVIINLSYTNISGKLPESIGLLKNLVHMDISHCNLWGPIPKSIGNITEIEVMSMSFNQLSGEVPSTISNLRHLLSLDLSSNHLGGQLPDAFANLQNLWVINLSNNFLGGEIPSSLSNISRLFALDISSNALTGFFPSRTGLGFLDISSNALTGFFPSIPGLILLNLSHNCLHEFPPWQSLQNLGNLYLQSNEIEGTFPSSICNITSLSYLDLSNNKFRGSLPPCIGNFSNELEVLDLRRNEFSGTIPTTLGNNLEILELSDNHMEGPLPHSLANCTALKVVDLGNNMISDTFPWWLQTLPQLRILILKSNYFHGSVSPPVANGSFSELQIIDLSHNYFTGLLPDTLFAALLALRNAATHHSIPLVDSYDMDYFYSVILSLKGDDREFTSVLNIVKTIDLSSNNFYGSIPDSLADLTSLWLLNLSHNHLNGSIPPAFGHLTALEQLDLSRNQLTGEIPHTLTNLTFLGSLNLSYNHLVGPIPEGGQFETFPSESYVGNLGLYGAPLTKNYGNRKVPPSPTVIQEDEDDDSGLMMGFTWQAVAQGYGCGVVIGFILGSVMLCIGKPRWFARFYNAEAANCLKKRKKRGRGMYGRR